MAIAQKASLATIATDPLRNFKFQVQITPGGGATFQTGFMNVQGLNAQVDVIAYREGGFNTTTQKMPGQADFAPIVMSHGVICGNQEDIAWLREIFAVIQGVGTGTATNDFRATVDVQVLDHPITPGNAAPVKAWFRVYNAWPTAVSYSDLDAGANALLITQLSLAHEGFDIKVAATGGSSTEVTF
jgi:phage tail-like protein